MSGRPSHGVTELLVILGVALLMFGPSKLPQLGKSVGEGLREFKKSVSSVSNEVTEAVKEAATDKQS